MKEGKIKHKQIDLNKCINHPIVFLTLQIQIYQQDQLTDL
jgi:hypothetical protein